MFFNCIWYISVFSHVWKTSAIPIESFHLDTDFLFVLCPFCLEAFDFLEVAIRSQIFVSNSSSSKHTFEMSHTKWASRALSGLVSSSSLRSKGFVSEHDAVLGVVFFVSTLVLSMSILTWGFSWIVGCRLCWRVCLTCILNLVKCTCLFAVEYRCKTPERVGGKCRSLGCWFSSEVWGGLSRDGQLTAALLHVTLLFLS
jgi:hypothetical protein